MQSSVWRGRPKLERLLEQIQSHPEKHWRIDSLPAEPPERAYCYHKNFYGYDVYRVGNEWFALMAGSEELDIGKLRRAEYPEIWTGDHLGNIEHKLMYEDLCLKEFRSKTPWPMRLAKKALAQPVHRLPDRLLRKLQRMVAN
jgi:hypothetical protein